MSTSSGDPDGRWTQPGDSTGPTANPSPSGYGTPSSPSYGKYGQGTALPPPPPAAGPPNPAGSPQWGGPTQPTQPGQPGQPGYGSGQSQWGQPGYVVPTRTGPAPGDPTTVEPTEALGSATIGLSVLLAVAVVAAAAFNPNQHQFVKDSFDSVLDGTQPPRTAADSYNLAGALLGLVEIGGWLTVCLWLTRIRQNVVALRQYDRRRSEAWVWLGWVIPFVNFWFPFQVVTDAVRSTAVAAGVPPIRTGFWWAAWVTMSLSSFVVAISQFFPPDQTLHRSLVAVVAVVTVVALVLWLRIVGWLGRNQDALRATHPPVSQ